MSWLLSGLSALAALTLLIGAVRDVINKTSKFWPPADQDMQNWFRWMFRAMVYPLALATAWHIFTRASAPPIAMTLIGGILFGAGLTGALAATTQMGWHNAFGDGSELLTTGWFRLCRHPIYASSFLFLSGWGLIAAHIGITIVLCIWAALYLVAPTLEEPWIEARFGVAYRQYRTKTPRFLPMFGRM